MSAPDGLGPITHAEQEDRAYLAYVGNETPRYILAAWLVMTPILAYYAWRWYLPELSLWMGWG